MKRHLAYVLPVAAMLGAAAPAAAQNIDYGNVSDPGDSGQPQTSGKTRRATSSYDPKRRYGGEIEPYIEVAQIVTKEFSPRDEVFTYSRIAAGVDGIVNGINNSGSVSARYERDFAWKKNQGDRDRLSAIANGYAALAPSVRLNAGGFADRRRVDGDGAIGAGISDRRDQLTQFYSVYAGPEVSATAGDVAVSANYRVGYTSVDDVTTVFQGPNGEDFDYFQDSVSHTASITAGVKPDTVVPVGLGVGGSYYREDSSNLDQRIEDARAQATVTVPVSRTVSVSGAVGYEKVEISSRDALRDEEGRPIVGNDGQYITNEAGPRLLAYDVDGLTWDTGVMWRPSNRTYLSAHVGRRYGSTGIYGQFYYALSNRHSVNVMVYDNVAGFGGQLTNAIAGLPTDFEAIRNPITGDLSGTVSSLGQGGSIEGALSNLRSSAFRARGIMGSYNYSAGRVRTGVSVGYDRRKFFGAPGTVLALADGSLDEYFWLNGNIQYKLDDQSGLTTSAYARWTKPEQSLYGDTTALGANAAYFRNLTGNLTATAALGVDGLEREFLIEDFWSASALLGMRYSF